MRSEFISLDLNFKQHDDAKNTPKTFVFSLGTVLFL